QLSVLEEIQLLEPQLKKLSNCWLTTRQPKLLCLLVKSVGNSSLTPLNGIKKAVLKNLLLVLSLGKQRLLDVQWAMPVLLLAELMILPKLRRKSWLTVVSTSSILQQRLERK